MSYISARTHPDAVSAELGRIREINAELIEALRPFAKTDWLGCRAEMDTATIVAHVHADHSRETILSSFDFIRAKAAIAKADGK
jgi:hypothetical protein